MLLQAYIREAKCHIALGNAQAALISLQTAKELDPSSDHAIMAEVSVLFKLCVARRCLSCTALGNSSMRCI